MRSCVSESGRLSPRSTRPIGIVALRPSFSSRYSKSFRRGPEDRIMSEKGFMFDFNYGMRASNPRPGFPAGERQKPLLQTYDPRQGILARFSQRAQVFFPNGGLLPSTGRA